MDFPLPILPDPERSLGPCEPRVAPASRRRDRGKDLPGRRIDLLDAVLGDLKEMLTIEGRPGMRGDLDRSQCLAARRIEGPEGLARGEPDSFPIEGDAVHVPDAREAVLAQDFGR